MKQHVYYIRYALQFADMQIPELVTIFNAQVQNRGWSSMRAYHDQISLPFTTARSSPSPILFDTTYPTTYW